MTTIYTSSHARHIRNWPVAVQFPEVADGLPLHPKEVIAACPGLLGKTICTLSEHVILWFVREVRLGRMKPADLAIRYVMPDGPVYTLRVDEDGEFLDPWPGGFFDERGELLFA